MAQITGIVKIEHCIEDDCLIFLVGKPISESIQYVYIRAICNLPE